MLSILYSDFEQFGCPNCGCDAAKKKENIGALEVLDMTYLDL